MTRFGLDDIQASAIVAMRLGQLTGLEREKIEEELATLRAKIEELTGILADEGKIFAIIKEELQSIRDRFGDDRRTEITAVTGEVDIEDLIPEEECVLTLTSLGYIKRQPMDTYKTQRRGGRGLMGMTRREEDFAEYMFVCSSHDYIMLFTNHGKVYRLKCYEVPESSRTSKGMNIVNLIPLEQDEKVTALIKVNNMEDGKYLCMVTRSGIIKRTLLSAYNSARKGGLIAIELDEGDELAWVRVTDGSNAFPIVDGQADGAGADIRDQRRVYFFTGVLHSAVQDFRVNQCLFLVILQNLDGHVVLNFNLIHYVSTVFWPPAKQRWPPPYTG